MAKAYFKLKDTGTTFYDVNQSKGVVADRVAELELTENVRKAKGSGVLIEVGKEEAEKAISKQEEEWKTAEKARISSQSKETVNTDSTSARVAIDGGLSTGDNATLNFKDGEDRGTAGAEEEFNAADVLEGTVSEVTDKLSGLNADQLNTLKTAETESTNRKGVITAIDEQLASSKEAGTTANSKKVNIGKV